MTKITQTAKRLKQFILVSLLASIFLIVSACALVTQPVIKTQVPKPPSVSAERLEKHVRHLSETLYPRSHDQEANLNAAADYIKKELENAGITVTEQPFEVDGKVYRNLLAHFGPKEGEVIIVGAHYDSHGISGMEVSPETHTPGADDNASGVAGLIELAHLLQKNPPKHPILLVAYTLEEPPHFRTHQMGSAVHARSITEADVPVRFMISLEMIGFFSDQPNSQRYPAKILHALYPDTGNFIAIIGRFADRSQTREIKKILSGAIDLPVYSMNAPTSVPGLDFSDHMNYWNENINAVMITDTAFFRNSNYHKPEDTAETLDYQRMAEVVQGVYAVLQNIK